MYSDVCVVSNMKLSSSAGGISAYIVWQFQSYEIDNSHNRPAYDLGKKNKIFYYSQKEHLIISRIARFGGKML